jgi:hypothetical protein
MQGARRQWAALAHGARGFWRPERSAPAPPPPQGSCARAWIGGTRSGGRPCRAVDGDSDVGQLERWIRAVDERERALPRSSETGLTTGSTGQVVLNPLAAYLRQLETVIARQ